MTTTRIVTASLGALVFSAAAQETAEDKRERQVIAAEVPELETGWEGDHMTGNWGGVRDQLRERGVHLQAGYIAEVFGNLSGGLEQGAAYQGLLEVGVDVETGPLGLWQGGMFHVSSLFPHGRPFSANYVGDILTASNIEAYESFRLYQLWYEHALANERFSIKFGQLLADDEFAFTGPGGNFLNASFGWPAFISVNTQNTGPAYFVAAPGVRLRLQPDERFYFQAGVYDGDSFDSPDGDPRINSHGTRIHLSEEQGVFAIAELGFRRNAAEPATAGGLPGEFKLGAWLHTADFPSNFEDENGDPIVLTGGDPHLYSENYGVYASAEQMLFREEEDQGLYGFLRAGASPRDRSLFEFVVDSGFTYTGPFPGRDEDIVGIGAVYAHVSRDIRDSERLDTERNGASYPGLSNFESVLEVFYQCRLNKWWTAQPDFQWIFNPGAAGGSDAVVIGLRTTFVF